MASPFYVPIVAIYIQNIQPLMKRDQTMMPNAERANKHHGKNIKIIMEENIKIKLLMKAITNISWLVIIICFMIFKYY